MSLDDLPPKDAERPDDGGARNDLHWQIVLELGRIALEDTAVQPLLQRATLQVSRGTGIRHTKVLRYRPERGDLLAVAGVGWQPGFVGGARFPVDAASPPGRCVQTGLAVVIEDLRGNAEFKISRPLADHGLIALANVPIAFDGKIWGVLEVDSDRAGQFRRSDMDFLQAVAALLAVALQRDEAMERIHAIAAEAQARSAAQTTLLREMQHRAKNNLSLVTAILARERHALARQQRPAAERFTRVMERVSAIAIAHDHLNVVDQGDGDPRGTTDLAGYLQALCSSLELSLTDQIAIRTDLDRCPLPFERAVAAGLIVNELVTNAAKYAYPEGVRDAVVRVTLRTDLPNAEAELTVADDGQGMNVAPPPVVPGRRQGGQGLSLIHLLLDQLGGEAVPGPPGHGTSVTMRFPLVV